MMQLHDKTRRRICLAAFFLLCLTPTVLVAAWCIAWQLPGHRSGESPGCGSRPAWRWPWTASSTCSRGLSSTAALCSPIRKPERPFSAAGSCKPPGPASWSRRDRRKPWSCCRPRKGRSKRRESHLRHLLDASCRTKAIGRTWNSGWRGRRTPVARRPRLADAGQRGRGH